MKNLTTLIVCLMLVGCEKESKSPEIIYADVGAPCSVAGEMACQSDSKAVLICSDSLVYEVAGDCWQNAQFCDMVHIEGKDEPWYVCNCDVAVCESSGCPLGNPGPTCIGFIPHHFYDIAESSCLCQTCDNDFCNQECIEEQGASGGTCDPDVYPPDLSCTCY